VSQYRQPMSPQGDDATSKPHSITNILFYFLSVSNVILHEVKDLIRVAKHKKRG
jgi:hypothetical protein